MSKRFFPQQMGGDRKRAKLDISISDHNFPLSQNKEPDQNTWGDDNDDEILLLASQACEEAYNVNDISLLPNYSLFMQPDSTSTQMYSTPGPSTSTNDFTFKKPSSNPPSAISTNLKEKCNRIASPLPGITANAMPKANEPGNLLDDFIFNDKVCKGQDPDYVYRQLLQLQEENNKLKSENGKLLEKCVTKEGEASILRTQLKTCQVSVDNARLEKIKAQEKVQMEWTEKLAAANNQMRDLRNQLDFKNLEIISIKEKCKKLESTKVKLTQITVGNNDISSSYRVNNSLVQNESMTQRRPKTLSSAVQTDNKAHFLTLNKTCGTATPPLPSLLPLILEASPPPLSLLEYNEKLSRTDIPYKCRVFSTFHKATSVNVKKEGKGNQMSLLYEDVVKIAGGHAAREDYFNVFNSVRNVLSDVQSRLETISQRMSTAFHKEMDEKYIDTTTTYTHITRQDLLRGRTLFKEEQEIVSRRIIAILSYVLESSSGGEMYACYEDREKITNHIEKICDLLDTTCTAVLFSGLLLSTLYSLPLLHLPPLRALSICRSIIRSRPAAYVSCGLLKLLGELCLEDNFRKELCPGTNVGNLKMDYDQGVLLYKKDNCHLQILIKQVEAALRCMESQESCGPALRTTTHLILLYSNINYEPTLHDKSRCDCQLVVIQVLVYALRICAVMWTHQRSDDCRRSLLRVCRCGVLVLYRCVLRDAELGSQLAHSEGCLVQLCEIMSTTDHSHIYSNMLSELAGTLQSSPEDMPPSFHRQPWLKSFDSFSIAD